MKATINPPFRISVLLLAAAVFSLTRAALAQPSDTWDGGGADDNWTTGNNWADNSAPGSPQGFINFAGSTRLTPNNNFSGYSSGYRIYFNSGAGAFTLNGNPIKFFDWGGNRALIQNDSANTQTVNLRVGAGNNAGGLDFAPNNGDIVYNGGSIDNGTIFLDDNAQLRVWGNTGRTVTLNKGVINGGGSTGTVAINGPATLIYNTTGFSYTGDTFINNGTLRLAASGAAPSTTLRLGDTSGSAGANLNLDGGLSAANTINVRSGSSGAKIIANTASTSGTATLSGSLSLDAGVTVFANSGGGVALSGSTLDLKNQTLTVNGDGSVTINGTLQQSTGSGKLTKNGAGTLTLGGANSYSGATTVNAGTLLVNGSTASGSAVTVAGGVLGGTGTINGTVAVNSGGTLAPGTSIGTLTVNNAVTLAGTTALEVNKTAGPSLTSDLVTGITALNCGGTVTVTATGNALAAGDEFTVFSASSYSGSFASITPAPGAGLAWDTNALPTLGKLRVHAIPIAVSNVASAAHSQSTIISSTKLLANDSDADNDPLTIVSASAVSGSASVSGGNVNYTAPGSGTSDTITYTISDGRGGTASASIHVTLTSGTSQGFNQLSLEPLGGGAVRLTYLGIPGTNYALDWRTNLTLGNWMPVITNPAAANGHLVFTNTSSEPENYFRTRHVP